MNGMVPIGEEEGKVQGPTSKATPGLKETERGRHIPFSGQGSGLKVQGDMAPSTRNETKRQKPTSKTKPHPKERVRGGYLCL